MQTFVFTPAVMYSYVLHLQEEHSNLLAASVVIDLQVVAKQALESEDNVPVELSLQKLLPAADELLQQCQVLTLQAGSPESKL